MPAMAPRYIYSSWITLAVTSGGNEYATAIGKISDGLLVACLFPPVVPTANLSQPLFVETD